MADTAMQIKSLKGHQNGGLNDGHSSLDIDKRTQEYHKLRQTGSTCRCSQNPVLQIYTHFKSMQKLHEQRQTRIAREEKKRHGKRDISCCKTFSVDSQSGRWLSLDLNSRQPVSSRMSNTQNIEIEQTNQNNSNLQHEKTLSADSIKSPTGFLKSSSEHFENNFKDSNANSSSQRRTNQSKNQINFNMSESPLGQRQSAQTKVHWNNVPPGRVTPAHIPIITIDRNRLI